MGGGGERQKGSLRLTWMRRGKGKSLSVTIPVNVNIVWENHECKHWSCRRRLDLFFWAGPVEGRDCCQNMVIATNKARTQEPRMLNKPFSDPIVCE